MEIVLVGLNFRTAPVEVREKVSFSAEQALQASEELRSNGILEETLVLSTCNRSEVYGVNPNGTRESAAALSRYLSRFHELQPDLLNRSLYHHYDRHAVRHLFRVSAGLGPFVSLLPYSGKVATVAYVLGTNLTGATNVTFNGTLAAFTFVSKTEVKTAVPSGATTGFVTITTPGGTLKSNIKFHVTP